MSSLGRTVLRLVFGGLCVAALAAIFAILSGEFGDGDNKVIGTSLLFAVSASTGGAGQALRLRGTFAALGTVVLGASGAAFALVTYGIWAEVGTDSFWQAVGAVGILALDGAHAAFVLARRRRADSPGTELATTVAVTAAAVSGTLGILAVLELVDGPWQPLAVILVVQLLATAAAPLLRRLAPEQTAPSADLFENRDGRSIAHELRAIADDLDHATTPDAVRDQADRLRHLARRPNLS